MPSLQVAIESKKFRSGAAKVKTAAKQVTDSTNKIDRSLKKTQTGLNATGAGFGSLQRKIAGAVGFYALSRYLSTGTKELAKFELGLANVSTLLDENASRHLPQFRDQIEGLQIKYGEAAESLTKGLYDIVSASIAAGEAMNVLEVSTIAAKAGLSTTAVAADTITTILNSYSLQAERAEYVSDILFTTIKGGKTTFNELGSSMGNVVSLAASAGLSLEEVSAALATMTRAGLSTDVAVTSLKGILTAFLAPQQKSRDAAKQMGLELSTNTLKAIGLTGVVQKLSTAETELVAETFSNVRALTGLSALLSQTEGHARDLENAMNALGASDKAYEKIQDQLQTTLSKTNQAWKVMKRESLEGLIPAIKDLGNLIVDLTPSIRSLMEQISKFGDANKMVVEESIAVLNRLEVAFWSVHAAGSKLLDIGNDNIGTLRAMEQLEIAKKNLKVTKDAVDATLRLDEAFTDLESHKFIGTQQDLDNLVLSLETGEWMTRDFEDALDNLSKTQIQPPSEGFVEAMESLGVQVEKADNQIKNFGKETWEKEVEGLRSLSEALDPEEAAKYNVQIDELISKFHQLDEMDKDIDRVARAEKVAEQEEVIINKYQDQIEDLLLQKDLIGATNEEREKAIAHLEAMRMLEAIDPSSKRYHIVSMQVQQYEALRIAIAKSNAELLKQQEIDEATLRLKLEQKDAEKRAAELIREVELEKELLFVTNEERERAIKLRKLEDATKVLGIERSKELVEQYKRELVELSNAAEVAELVDIVKDGTRDMIRAPLEAILSETESLGDLLEDSLRNIGENILRTLYEQTITQPIMNALSGAFAGLGSGGSGTGLSTIFAAKGMVLNGPTVIPLAGGAAIAGEDGKEAVMPLTRTSSGDLGVKTDVAAQSPAVTVPVTVMNVPSDEFTKGYMESDDGGQVIVNQIRRNADVIKAELQ